MSSGNSHSQRPYLTLILLAALTLRFAAAFVVERQATAAGQQFLVEGDANGYWELARKLATGRIYAIHEPPRYVLRTPGFPLLLAGSIRVFGDSVLAARLVLAVVGTLCCYLTYVLGRDVHSHTAGLLAATYTCVHPLHIGNSVLILSENPFTLSHLLALVVFYRLIRKMEAPSDGQNAAFWLSAVAGVLMGGAVLVRPAHLIWLAVSLLAILAWGHTLIPNRRRIAVALVMICTCTATLMPWIWRNYWVTGHVVVTSLWSGPSLYDGLNPAATGASDMRFFDSERVMTRMSEYEMNAHYRDRALQFARRNPRAAAELAVKKAMLFLSPVPNMARRFGWPGSVICGIFWLLLFGFAARGLACRRWSGPELLVTAGPLLLFLAVHMVFVGSVRYRLPFEFPFSVLSAAGFLAVFRSGRSELEPVDPGSENQL